MSDLASGNTDSRRRRFVVTGAAGFIGGALVRFLESQDCEVIAVDHSAMHFERARYVIADLRIPGVLTPLVDSHTTVFHMAASADVLLSIDNPRHDFENTFGALFEVLEAARSTGCRVIYPSTASIFDPTGLRPLDERSFPRPSSPYAAGKLAGEAYCFAYHRAYDVDVRIARLFNVYGVGMRRFVIFDIVRKIQASPDKITLRGDGEQVRDYLYIDDAVRALILVDQRGVPGQDYNLASGTPVTIMEIAKRIARLMGLPNLRILTTGRSFRGDTLKWYADIRKVRTLGFDPAVTIDEGLAATVDWLTREQ